MNIKLTLTPDEFTALQLVMVSPWTVAGALFPDEQDEERRRFFVSHLQSIRGKARKEG